MHVGDLDEIVRGEIGIGEGARASDEFCAAILRVCNRWVGNPMWTVNSALGQEQRFVKFDQDHQTAVDLHQCSAVQETQFKIVKKGGNDGLLQ